MIYMRLLLCGSFVCKEIIMIKTPYHSPWFLARI